MTRPCADCAATLPVNAGNRRLVCDTCQPLRRKQASRKHYLANKDRMRKYWRAYYRANREHYLALFRNLWAKHHFRIKCRRAGVL